MKDSECILVEFINEDYKVAIGYWSWLQNETLRSKETLQKAIEEKEEVAINWPVNCEIVPASKMQKKYEIAHGNPMSYVFCRLENGLKCVNSVIT